MQESGEMYLETILVLTKKSSHVRSIDISEYMGYSKPSVSRAVGLLKNGGYITVDKDGFITLTEEGKALSEQIYQRHKLLARLLVELGVPEEIATEDACKMEHVISPETFRAIQAHFAKE